jgi:hypothetical protein
MIIQWGLNFIDDILTALWSLVPPLPAGVQDTFNTAVSGADSIMHSIANFGVILPFDTMAGLLTVWVSLIGFWAAVSVVKLVMKGFGR